MTDITAADWRDYCEGKGELRERPAEPGDMRFEVTRTHEPDEPASMYYVAMIDDKGKVVESFTTDDPGSAVEAFREHQQYSFEELYEPYGIRWQQEQRERNGW